MRRFTALAFPFLCAMLVVLVIVIGKSRGGLELAGGRMASPGPRIDPVCHMEVGDETATMLDGVPYFFCSPYCRDLFLKTPKRFLTEVCLVCRSQGKYTPIPEGERFEATWQGKTHAFCSAEHRQVFRDDPAGFFMHTMWGIPNWLYYTSVAFILIVSFGVFEWLAAREDRRGKASGAPPRLNLLAFAPLHHAIIHPLTRFFARAVVLAAFVLIIAAGLFGNQIPSKNIAPILTWTVWWGGLVWLILYFGKAWCYVCPWESIANWSEGLRFWGPKKEGLGLGLKWPRLMRNIWPATLLFVALTWVELGFGVTMNPRATAWLGLGMVGLAFVSAFLFDRESFCRYGCLVGRISGLYALFSPVEVRAVDHDTCRACRSKACFKGSEKGDPCPTFQYLPGMEQNTYCISCMECLKTCDRDNVALRLRPWASDLAARYRPRSDEAYLALLMLSLAGFHGLTMTGAWREILDAIQSFTGLGETLAFTLGMAGLMVMPGLIYAVLVALSRWMAQEHETGYRAYFIRYAYAMLPIALFYHLAHNSEHLLMEGQKVLALLSDPFGWEWDLFGTAEKTFAPLVDLPTLWLIQVLFVMIGHVYSLWIARRIASALFQDPKRAFRSQVPMLIAMVLFSLVSLWLLKQPMEMRTSAM